MAIDPAFWNFSAGLAALAVTLFIPGYFMCLAFYARKGEIDSIERITLSFVFSVTLIPLLILAENELLMIPVNFFTVLGNFILFTLAGLSGYLYRTGKIPFPEKLRLFAVPKKEAVPIVPFGKNK